MIPAPAAITAAVIAAGEELMRWFKSKDGTIYPDPANAPESERKLAEIEAELRAAYGKAQTNREDEMAYLRQQVNTARQHARRLQEALGALALRLKVLDLDQLEKDVGADGTVPLRLSLAELRKLMAAYDNEKGTWVDSPDYGRAMSQTTTAPVNYAYATVPYDPASNYTYTNTNGTWGRKP